MASSHPTTQEPTTLNLTSPFTLYYATHSICATMVRLTLAFAVHSSSCPTHPHMTIHLHELNISPSNPEQLSEFYLCNINPDGQVPVLANDELLPKPMPESVDITWYICEWYPGLLPRENEGVIRELMEKLHEINYGALTFGKGSKHPTKLVEKVREILGSDDGVSEGYRTALERKEQILLSRQDTLTPATVKNHESLTQNFCAKIVALMDANGTTFTNQPDSQFQYIFGANPTALDAHVLTFLRRVHDAGRDELVPGVLVGWAERFSEEEMWKGIVVDGSTLPPYVS